MILYSKTRIDVKLVLRRVLTLSLKWKPICKDVEAGGDEELVFFPGGQDHGSAATPWNLKDQFEGAVRMLVDGASRNWCLEFFYDHVIGGMSFEAWGAVL
jgi:hypothetical protein